MSIEIPEVSEFLRKDELWEKGERKIDLKRIDTLPSELKNILPQLKEISGTWDPVEFFDIKDEKAAKKKFFEDRKRGQRIEPQFEYPNVEKLELGDSRERLLALQKQVRDFDPKNNRLARLARVALDAKISDDIALCDLASAIKAKDEKAIKAAMNTLFPPLNEEQVEFEKGELHAEIHPPAALPKKLSDDEITYLKNRQITAQEAKALFEWTLDQYGLLKKEGQEDGWTVEVGGVSVIDVRSRSKTHHTIYIPDPLEDGDETLYGFLPLVAHEVEGHARHSTNGQKMFGLGGGQLMMGDQALLEGLAMRKEKAIKKEYYGEPESKDPRFYAHAVKAAEAGKTFSEIFDEQLSLYRHMLRKVPMDQELPPEDDGDEDTKARNLAFRTTRRVMRGHTDMSNSEAYAARKDLGYGRGELMDAQLVRAGKAHFNEAAYLVKGGLDMLAELDLKPEDLPHQDKHLTENVLIPLFLEEMRQGQRLEISEDLREKALKLLQA